MKDVPLPELGLKRKTPAGLQKAPVKKLEARGVSPRLPQTRVKAARAVMAGRQCTHLLVTDPVDVEYISGFRSSNATLLISSARLDLFTDFRYMESAREFCRIHTKWKLTQIEESDFKFLKRKIRGGAAVGVQTDALTVDRYEALKRTLPGAEFVTLSGDIADIAVQKLDSEIADMAAAARIGDKAFKALLPLIKGSAAELEIARALENLCADYGSEKPAFDTIVLFGERCALPHGRPGGRKLAKGDFVLIDFGCTVNGFRSDMTRTLVFGEASDEQRKVYDAVLRAQRCACLAARAGMTGKALDSTARSAIAESGYGEHFGHATGHGVGLRVHEKPRLNKNNTAALLENTVVTIEPGIYIPNMGGVRIEDMVVLQKDGAAALTHSPRELIELPL